MTRPLLLDLFCGAGGASMGYHRAGFDVIGVDIRPQPHYPFEFHQADVMRVLGDWAANGACGYIGMISDYAAVHASPPCQDHIRGGLQHFHGTGGLLASARELLSRTGLPWAIENVPGAPMRPDYILCGSHFGLPVRRHRWFETSWQGFTLMACDHSRPVHGIYGRPCGRRGAWPGMLPDGLAEWSSAMGIDWMNTDELAQAIPPAYTEHIGTQLLTHLETTTSP